MLTHLVPERSWQGVRRRALTGVSGVFLSTFEKQLDSKRRIVVPQDFRAALSGPFDGIFCFPPSRPTAWKLAEKACSTVTRA